SEPSYLPRSASFFLCKRQMKSPIRYSNKPMVNQGAHEFAITANPAVGCFAAATRIATSGIEGALPSIGQRSPASYSRISEPIGFNIVLTRNVRDGEVE